MNEKIQGQIRVKGELSEYIKGRISGIIEGVTCNPDRRSYAIVKCIGDTFFRFDCTEKQFTTICNLVRSRCRMFGEFEFLKI